MQRKTVSPKTSKTSANLKARLKPISLEEPLTGSPFLKLIEDEPQKVEDSRVDAASQSGEENSSFVSSEEDKPAAFAAAEINDSSSTAAASLLAEAAEKQLEAKNQSPVYISSNSSPSIEDEENISNSQRQGLPKKTVNAIAPRKLCRLLEVDDLDDIFSVSDLLKASSLKLYATLVNLADKNGRLKIKAHELMRKAGIKGIATYYKQERWLSDLGLIEKRAKPGPHEGSSYRIYALDSLPLSDEIIAEFNQYLREQSE